MDSKPIEVQTAWCDPAGVLPDQYRLSGNASPLGCAARRLMQAVLQRAVNDYVEAGSSGSADFEPISSWFGSRADDSPFSFESICDALDLDGDAVRKGVARRLAEAIALDSAGDGSQTPSLEIGQPDAPSRESRASVAA